jgi:hypothetical protein
LAEYASRNSPAALMDRLFIDECLSAALVAVAKERGIPADYGPHGWMAGLEHCPIRI